MPMARTHSKDKIQLYNWIIEFIDQDLPEKLQNNKILLNLLRKSKQRAVITASSKHKNTRMNNMLDLQIQHLMELLNNTEGHLWYRLHRDIKNYHKIQNKINNN